MEYRLSFSAAEVMYGGQPPNENESSTMGFSRLYTPPPEPPREWHEPSPRAPTPPPPTPRPLAPLSEGYLHCLDGWNDDPLPFCDPYRNRRRLAEMMAQWREEYGDDYGDDVDDEWDEGLDEGLTWIEKKAILDERRRWAEAEAEAETEESEKEEYDDDADEGDDYEDDDDDDDEDDDGAGSGNDLENEGEGANHENEFEWVGKRRLESALRVLKAQMEQNEQTALTRRRRLTV